MQRNTSSEPIATQEMTREMQRVLLHTDLLWSKDNCYSIGMGNSKEKTLSTGPFRP